MLHTRSLCESSVALVLAGLVIAAEQSFTASEPDSKAQEQPAPDRIDTFPSSDGSIYIDVNSTGEFFAEYDIFARFRGDSATRHVAKFPFPLQGAPVWSSDNRLMILHTGTLSAGTWPILYERHADLYKERAEADLNTIWHLATSTGFYEDMDLHHLYVRAVKIDDAKSAAILLATGDGHSRNGSHFKPFSITWNYANGTFGFSWELPRVIPPTSAIRMAGEIYLTSGTGFIITPSGYIVTCAHVLDKAYHADVRMRGQAYNAELIGIDEKKDVALLKIRSPSDLPFLALGDSDAVELGDDVSTVGFPNPTIQGFNPKFTKGEISATTGFHDDPNTFQISVPFQGGNSGGPLVNKGGEVVGIIAAKLDPIKTASRAHDDFVQNVNYAVKANHVRDLAKRVPIALPKNATLNTPERSQVQRVAEAVVRITTYGLPAR